MLETDRHCGRTRNCFFPPSIGEQPSPALTDATQTIINEADSGPASATPLGDLPIRSTPVRMKRAVTGLEYQRMAKTLLYLLDAPNELTPDDRRLRFSICIFPPSSFALIYSAGSDHSYIVPALIADAGEPAAWRYVEFFTANIRNPNTRRAYARACEQFLRLVRRTRPTLTTIRPHDVATYIETLQQTHSAPGVKQQLAAVRMLFDWLITGQVVPVNPASAVRGPKHVVKTGKTPVLDADEWRKLIDTIPTERCAIYVTGR